MSEIIVIKNLVKEFPTDDGVLRVLNNVTIGIGAFIHISNAYALLVSLGFTSLIRIKLLRGATSVRLFAS